VHKNIRDDERISSITCFPSFFLVFFPCPFIIFFVCPCLCHSIDLLLLLVVVFSISIALGYFSPTFFFFPAFISGLETCFKDFLSVSLWLLLPFLILYFIVFLFSILFFDFPFLSLFTSFLFTVLNSFHHNLLYSYADVIFLPLFLMFSVSQVRRNSERCYATVLNALLARRNLVTPHVRPVLSPLTASGHLSAISTGRIPEIFGC